MSYRGWGKKGNVPFICCHLCGEENEEAEPKWLYSICILQGTIQKLPYKMLGFTLWKTETSDEQILALGHMQPSDQYQKGL